MKNNIFNLLKVFLFFLIITGGGNTITLSAQQSGKRIITGQVIDDENQEPLIGVSVLVVGTTTGTITDFDGNYSVELPAGSKQLQFSYIGYASQTVNVSANVLNIRLKSDTEMLSDVVVIGYGTQRKKRFDRLGYQRVERRFQYGTGQLAGAAYQWENLRCTDYVEQWFAYGR